MLTADLTLIIICEFKFNEKLETINKVKSLIWVILVYKSDMI